MVRSSASTGVAPRSKYLRGLIDKEDGQIDGARQIGKDRGEDSALANSFHREYGS